MAYNDLLAGQKAYNYALPASNFLVAAPNGLASNAGTLASPKDIGSAFSSIAAGGTVVLRGGIYECGNYEYGTKPFSIQAYQNEVPVLDGSVGISGFVSSGGKWVLSGYTLTPVGSFTLAEQSFTATTQYLKNYQQIINNGKVLKQVGSLAEVVPGTFFVEEGEVRKLWLGEAPASTRAVKFKSFLNLGAGGSNVAAGSEPKIRGLKFQRYSLRMLRLGFTGSSVENCLFYQAGAHALVTHASNVLADKCTFDEIGMVAVFDIMYNDVTYKNLKGTRQVTGQYNLDWTSGFIKTQGNVSWTNPVGRTSGVRHTIDNCYAEMALGADGKPKAGSTAFWFDNHHSEAICRNSLAVNFNIGFFFEISQGGKFEGNTAIGCNLGVSMLHSWDLEIRHNTLVNCGFAIAVIDQGRRNSTAPHDQHAAKPHYYTKGAKIAGNLLIGCRNNFTDSRAVHVVVFGSDNPSTYVTAAEKNVLQRTNGFPVNAYRHKVGAGHTLLVSYDNVRTAFSIEQNSIEVPGSETIVDSQYRPTSNKLIGKGLVADESLAITFGVPVGTVLSTGAQYVQDTASLPCDDRIAAATAPLLAQIAALELENAELEALSADLQATVADAQANVATLELVVAGLESDKLGLQEAVNVLQAERLILVSRVDALEAEKLALSQRVSDLESQNTSLAASNLVLDGERLRLQSELGVLESRIVALEADKAGLAADIVVLEARIVELEEEALNSYTMAPREYIERRYDAVLPEGAKVSFIISE